MGACQPARIKISCPLQVSLLGNLVNLISRYATLVAKLGWEDFVNQRRGRGDFARLEVVPHLACRLLRQYKHLGAPIVLALNFWTEWDRQSSLAQVLHQSMLENLPFLCKKFASMVGKGQWVILPYLVARNLQGLRLSPPWVKEERDQRPRWFGDYSYSKLNCVTLPLAELFSVPYGQALDRLLQLIVFADPAWEPVYILKANDYERTLPDWPLLCRRPKTWLFPCR